MKPVESPSGPTEPERDGDDAVALVSLDEAAERPVETVGRKARTLGRLRREGLPVPEGFVLEAQALPGVFAALEEVEGSPTGGLHPRVHRAFGSVTEALAPHRMAVRSSAIDEDRESASYAGQFDTVLDVRGSDSLAEAVRRCSAATDSAHLAAYRGSRDAEAGRDAPGLALIFQRMVPAEASGVAFTADPRTGAREVVVVEAVSGVGERLVSGERTPERWRISDQGIQRESGPETVLDAETAEAVAVLARRAESILGPPQDVEWALVDGSLYLLQSRPITAGLDTVAPVPIEVEPPERGFWMRDTAHFPRPFHPLFASIYIPRYEEAVAEAFRDFGVLVEGLEIREVGGWPYSRIVPPGDRQGPAPPAWLLWLLSRLAPSLRERMRRARRARERDLERKYVSRWWEEWRPELDEWIRRADAVSLGTLDREELAHHYRETVDTFDRGLRIHFQLFPPFFLAVADLMFFCRDELGWDKGRTAGLLAGESSMSSEPGRALEELAEAAAEDPAVLEVLEDPGAEPLARLRSRAPGFARRFSEYQERYGLRVLHYDFGTPTFRERPAMVFRFLRNQLGDPDDATEGPSGNRVARHREERVREARSALGDRPEVQARFEKILERAHRAYPVREDNEFFALSILGLLRYAAQEAGRRMVEAGHLDRFEQVHFLRQGEVEGWLEEPLDLREVARRREGERRWALENPGPSSYGEDPGPPPNPAALPPAGRRVLRALLWIVDNDLDTDPPESEGIAGVGASPGTYTGPVRIVRSEAEFEKVRGGDVLVCPITSPTWSVLFPSIGALVTDAGGLLSHPAIIAREFGIPSVLATGGATDELEDGQMVTVDGTTGRVEPC